MVVYWSYVQKLPLFLQGTVEPFLLDVSGVAIVASFFAA
jgi:hypothetical protein